MSEVSIVIPIYNSAKYLDESLKGLITQSFKDIEIICVDDCSDDNSSEIINKYASIDSRITYKKTKKNTGAGEARNLGFEFSAAPYVVFLDADDIFDRSLIEKSYREITKENADMVVYNYSTFDNDIGITSDSKISKPFYPPGSKLNHLNAENLPKDFLTYWATAPWVKMYNSEFLKKTGIKFQDIESCNDVFFSDMTTILANKISIVKSNIPLVWYRTNTIDQISAKRTPFFLFKALLYEKKFLKKAGLWEKYQISILIRAIVNSRSELLNCLDNEIAEAYYIFFQKDGLGCLESNLLKKSDFQLKGYYYLLKCFFEEPFYSKWFALSVDFFIRLVEKEHLITHLWTNEFIGKKVCIWGIGARGLALIKFCQFYNLTIDYYVDSSPEKIGKTGIYNNTIRAYNDVEKKVDIILTTSKTITDYVKNKAVNNNSVNIIDISFLLV